MKVAIKILKSAAILIIILTILLVSAPFLLKNKVGGIVLNSFNRSLSTKLEFGSFKLSFLSKFPKASLELKNVLVHSSPGFDPKQFTETSTDTLLFAKSVSVQFSITDIVKGNYDIERISAKTGRAFFYTDSAGKENFNISADNGKNGSEILTINLERINLTDIKAHYNNQSVKLILNGLVNNGKLKTKISGDKIDFIAAAMLKIDYFKLFNTAITTPVPAGLNLVLQSSKSGIVFKKGTLSIQNSQLGIEGLVSHDNTLDLKISGRNLDLLLLRNYTPDKYTKIVSDFVPSGILTADCTIKGPLTKTKSPHVEINYRLVNGRVLYGKSGMPIHQISFTGNLSNGLRNSVPSSEVLFSNLRAKLGSTEYSGSFRISDFANPRTEIFLKGNVYPEELKRFFDIKKFIASGSVDIDLKLATNYWPKDSVTLDDLLNLKPDAKLTFKSFNAASEDKSVQNVNGDLSLFENKITANNLSFTFKKQKIRITGEFGNFPRWLAGRPAQLIAKGDVTFSRLIPEVYQSKKSSGSEKRGFRFPGDMKLDINFRIDSLDYKTFSSTKISGSLNYKPRLLTFKSFYMNSLNGTIEGSGLVLQNSNRSLIAKGNFDLTKIDIKKTFTTFHNFGQDFIKAENLSGALSGTLTILIPTDSLFNVQIKSVTAEGKYVIVNGALTNFEPVKHLSSYIELSELENIHFEKLENDFFIRKNLLYVPQMDVRSSAADLSVNGRHSFENNYEYHVKILLSEILSRKRRRFKSNVTEFGVVEDDGLGRTSMLLKVTGNGDNIKVGYDLKAAGGEIKNNIKAEKQNLKTILNQEYGLYKSDTTVNQKPTRKKSRFRITWDEADTTKKP